MKKSQQPVLFIWVLILLVWGLFSACSLQNNALPNLPPDNAQASSSPLSEKDQFLACLPEVHTLKGSDVGNITLETHHSCFKPEDIKSVEYFYSNLSGSSGTILAKKSETPFRVRLQWKNGVFLFSETELKSGVRLRSKNIAINPYDFNEQTAAVLSDSKPNLDCLPKVVSTIFNHENNALGYFTLNITSACFRNEDFKYVYYSTSFPESVNEVQKMGDFIQETPPALLGRIPFSKRDAPPFQSQYPFCNEYAGTELLFLAHIRLKSGEYLTTAPIKIDFPKREGCPPPPDGQAGSGK
ncbi:MAG: hypothetical protein AB7I41_06630 [Candidatus Sericytochromatia bacterium]